MSKPVWLARDEVLLLHEDQIATSGGSCGILKDGELDACIARPKMLAFYEPRADAFRLAASLAHGLATAHCFVDGNKRVAAMAAFTFLFQNGFLLNLPKDSGVDLFLRLAAGEVEEPELAAALRANSVPLPE